MKISDLYLAGSITCGDYFHKERFYLDAAVHRCTFIASLLSLLQMNELVGCSLVKLLYVELVMLYWPEESS